MPLNAAETTQYQQFAERLADAAAVAIKPYFRSQLQVDDKGGRLFDPVTLADKAAERAMRELILSEFPEHGILGEEEDAVTGSSSLTWVLDPIDGTRAFITGLPLWGTLIALNDGSRPVIGVMNQPFTGERFVGTPEGAWLNGAPLKTRACASLSKARVMCTSPRSLIHQSVWQRLNALPNRPSWFASVVTVTPIACWRRALWMSLSRRVYNPMMSRR